MCARTRCWMDFGYPGFGPQRIRREILIAGLHEMYAREFAVYCLGIAICSLAAPIQFALTQQKQYAEQRIL
uniref:Uncharacterized protein n=1 Tax=Meloidogyne javanica TaxID=6303 RepID=A0A915LC27_MELJA